MQLNEEQGRPSLGAALREVSSGVSQVVRSEIELAKVELKDSGRLVGKRLTQAALFGFIAMLGITPFIAFLVIGLGEVLSGNYWLSSLLVSLVFMVVGLPLALRALRDLRQERLALPRTRETFGRAIEEFKEREKERRAA